MAYQDVILADSPMLAWPLAETSGTTVSDVSGNGRSGTYSGTPLLATASVATFTSPFFEAPDYVQSDASISLGSTFSIECWFRRDDFQTGQTAGINTLIGDLVSVSNGVVLRWDGDNSTLKAYVANGSDYSVLSTTANDDTDYHVVLTADGANGIKLFLNGSQVDSSAATAAGCSMPWQVARSEDGRHYYGTVAWASVYDSVLSPSRVTAHYFAGLGSSAQEIVAGTALSTAVAYGPTALLGGNQEILAGVATSSADVFGPISVQGAASGEAQTIMAGTAARGHLVFGPRHIGDPLEEHPPLTAFLVGSDGTVKAELTESAGRRFITEFCEVGSGQLHVWNDDPVLGLIEDGDLVRFEVDGVAAQTILAQEIDSTVIADDEEAGEITSIAGPGHGAVLEEALVYPARAFTHGPGPAAVGGPNNRTYVGVGHQPTEEDRLFFWGSVDYFAGMWPAATTLATLPDAIAWYSAHGTSAGADFPDDTASVIWAGYSMDDAPGGEAYMRGTITVPTTGPHTIYLLLDNWGTVYVDGQPVLETNGASAFQQAEKVTLELSAGEHVIAVKGVNWEHEGDNPGAMALCVYALDGTGEPTDLVGHTDSTWKALGYTEHEPGMRVGEIIENMIIEAQARGALMDVRTSFSWQFDSAGQEWPDVIHSTKTGTDLLTFLRELSAIHIDWRMDPGSMTLSCWNKGTMGQERDVTFERGTNLRRLRITERKNATTSMLTRWHGGWLDQTDPTETRREALLGLGTAQTVAMASDVAAKQIEEAAEKLRTVEAEIEHDAGNAPYVDFRAGDQVTVPDRALAPTVEPVRSIETEEDDEGNLNHKLNLGAILLDPEEALAQAVKKMTNGTLRGQSRVATPVSQIRLGGATSAASAGPSS